MPPHPMQLTLFQGRKVPVGGDPVIIAPLTVLGLRQPGDDFQELFNYSLLFPQMLLG